MGVRDANSSILIIAPSVFLNCFFDKGRAFPEDKGQESEKTDFSAVKKKKLRSLGFQVTCSRWGGGVVRFYRTEKRTMRSLLGSETFVTSRFAVVVLFHPHLDYQKNA